MLEEFANAVRSQNKMTLCPLLLRTVENTAVYIILYLFIYIKKVISDNLYENVSKSAFITLQEKRLTMHHVVDQHGWFSNR